VDAGVLPNILSVSPFYPARRACVPLQPTSLPDDMSEIMDAVTLRMFVRTSLMSNLKKIMIVSGSVLRARYESIGCESIHEFVTKSLIQCLFKSGRELLTGLPRC
jgi:hypothetical protein